MARQARSLDASPVRDDGGLGEHLKELLAPLGPITLRRMFSGQGVFLDGLMFALIMEDVLYLKVDSVSRPAFEAEHLGALTYNRSGTSVSLSYWQAPERLLDDADELRKWALTAVAVARRSAKPLPKRSAATIVNRKPAPARRSEPR